MKRYRSLEDTSTLVTRTSFKRTRIYKDPSTFTNSMSERINRRKQKDRTAAFLQRLQRARKSKNEAKFQALVTEFKSFQQSSELGVIEIHYTFGIEYQKRKMFHLAIFHYSKVLLNTKFEHYAKTCVALSSCYKNLNMREEALGLNLQALEFGERHGFTGSSEFGCHVNLGILYEKFYQDTENAKTQFAIAVDLGNQIAKGSNLGNSLFRPFTYAFQITYPKKWETVKLILENPEQKLSIEAHDEIEPFVNWSLLCPFFQIKVGSDSPIIEENLRKVALNRRNMIRGLNTKTFPETTIDIIHGFLYYL